MRAVIAQGSALFLSILLPVAALAQQPATLPPELLQPQTPERPREPGPTLMAPEPEPAPDPLPDAGPSFALTAVTFEGATAFDDAALSAAVAEFVGTPVTFADLRRLTAEIERLYDESGFVAVRAIVEPQRLAGGVLRVTIIEGAITEIVIRGELDGAAPKLRELLEPLRGMRPIPQAELERRLLLARDLPGVSLVAALRSLAEGGSGDLALLIDAVARPFDAFVSVSNYATDFAGPVVGTAGVGFNSVILSGDRIEATALTAADPSEQTLGQLRYDAPTGVEGLRGELLVSTVVSEPGAGVEPFDLDYRSWIGQAGLDYSLIRSRARSVTLGAGFEIVSQSQNAAVPSLEVDEQLRIVYASARLVETGLFGGLLDARATGRVGLDAFGASSEGDAQTTGDPQFVAVFAEVDYRRLITREITLRARLRGQISSDDVPSYEVFSLGNYTIGRGFQPGSAAGDEGFAGGLEAAYAYTIAEIPEITRPEFYTFIEGGRVFGEDRDAGLASLGLGSRFTLFDRVEADAAVAIPIDSSELVDDEGVTALFRVTSFF